MAKAPSPGRMVVESIGPACSAMTRAPLVAGTTRPTMLPVSRPGDSLVSTTFWTWSQEDPSIPAARHRTADHRVNGFMSHLSSHEIEGGDGLARVERSGRRSAPDAAGGGRRFSGRG